MMDDEKKHLIELYFDSQLDESRVAEAMQLIEQSDEARQYYNELKAMAEQAEGFMLEGGDDFWQAQKDSILDRIEEEEEKKITPVKAAGKFMGLRTLAVAASLLLVGVITVYEVRQNPDFNRPKDQDLSIPPQTGVDTTIGKIQDDDEVDEVKVVPEVASRATPQETTRPTPAPASVVDQAVTAEKPTEITEKGAEEPLVVFEPQAERKLDVSRSNLIQPSLHHEEITLEQGKEALDRGRTEEPTTETGTSEPKPREGVGIKSKELAVPTTEKDDDQRLAANVDFVRPKIVTQPADSRNVDAFVADKQIDIGALNAGEGIYIDRAFTTPSEMGVSIAVGRIEGVDSLTYWSFRVDSLEIAIAIADSRHNRMEESKATRRVGMVDTLAVDSLPWYYAEAIYKTAIFSPDSVNIRQYIYKLSRLKRESDSALAETIARYITDLEPRIK